MIYNNWSINRKKSSALTLYSIKLYICLNFCFSNFGLFRVVFVPKFNTSTNTGTCETLICNTALVVATTLIAVTRLAKKNRRFVSNNIYRITILWPSSAIQLFFFVQSPTAKTRDLKIPIRPETYVVATPVTVFYVSIKEKCVLTRRKRRADSPSVHRHRRRPVRNAQTVDATSG